MLGLLHAAVHGRHVRRRRARVRRAGSVPPQQGDERHGRITKSRSRRRRRMGHVRTLTVKGLDTPRPRTSWTPWGAHLECSSSSTG